MSLLNLMNQKVTVSRLIAISGDKTAFSTITAEYVNIQRMDDQRTTMLGGVIGKMFRIYSETGADIEVGDNLRDTDTGEDYKVLSVSIPASLGSFEHYEITVQRIT